MAIRDVLFENSAGNFERGPTPLLNKRVTTSSPVDKQMLQYDETNSEWTLVNGSNADSLSGTSLAFGSLSSGDVICYDGTNWTNGTLGDGLAFSGGTLSVKLGDGVTTDASGNLTLDRGLGLIMTGGTLEVDAGDGLTFNGNALAVAPGADPGDLINPNGFQDVADKLNQLLQELRAAKLIA